MAATSAASLAEEMSRFEEEIRSADPPPGYVPPLPISAPRTTGMPTQASMTGPTPGPFMMPVGPPPMMAMSGPGPVGPPGVPGPPPSNAMPGPPGTGMPMPMPMPGMPPPMVPPMGQMPFMVPMPMPMPMAGVAPPGMAGATGAASGGAVMPGTLSDEQKKEWESQFGKEQGAGTSKKKQKKNLRTAAGVTWVDPTLDEWDESDFRIFAGDLGHECTDEVLFRAFSKYPSLKKCKVVRDSRTNKSRGFGFVSFKDPKDYLSAIREMNGKYVAGRPIKLRKSTWKDRQLTVARRKQKEKERLGLK